MDLQEPSRKMSKSISSPLGSIYMRDDPKEIERKIRKAVTDTDGEVRFDREAKPGLSNLLEIFASLSSEKPEAIASRYSRYGDLKNDLAALVVETLVPISARYRELRGDPAVLRGIVDHGAQGAAAVSGPVYRRAAHAMGLT
jgi:tryptophanyl-tRNA synthetase